MRAGLSAVAVALALAGAPGCVNVETKLPPTLPEYRYTTPRSVAAAIPPEQARQALREAFGRARSAGQTFTYTIGEKGFSFRWVLELPVYADQEHEFDFTYAEVEPVIVDLRPAGGEQGVSFRRGGKDVDYAWLVTPTLSDAEIICDAIAALKKGVASPARTGG